MEPGTEIILCTNLLLDKPSNFQVPGCWESDIEKRSFLHKICRKYLDESVFNTEEVSDFIG